MDLSKLTERTIADGFLPSAYRYGGNALVVAYRRGPDEQGAHRRDVALLPWHDDDLGRRGGWELDRVPELAHLADRYRGWFIPNATTASHTQDLRVFEAARQFVASHVNPVALPPGAIRQGAYVCYDFGPNTRRILVMHPNGWDINSHMLGQRHENRRRERLALARVTEGTGWWVLRSDVTEGTPVADGGDTRVPLATVNLNWIWIQSDYRTTRFLELLQPMVIEDYLEDRVAFCTDCSQPGLHVDMTDVEAVDGWVCHDCFRRYRECCNCAKTVRYFDSLDGQWWCTDCRDENWSFCDHCDTFYLNSDGHYHEDGTGCCESPEKVFSIRNNGHDPLPNDEPVTVSLPAGVISEEGIEAISYRLYVAAGAIDRFDPRQRQYLDLRGLLPELGYEWQTGRGNYTKRLSSLAYKRLGLKLSPSVISAVGSICSEHSRGIADLRIEVTRDLNQGPGDFCHEDSCWWQSYYPSRCALKTNGGFGLRTFNEGGRYPTGRAWVIPLKVDGRDRLVPTFETLDPSGFVVFNGYEDLEGFAPARIMAHLAGMTYRKVELHAPPMYINNDSGYLIAGEDIASRYNAPGSVITLPTEQHSNLYDIEKREHSHAA